MDVSSIVQKNTHKYVIELPKNLLDAYILDKANWGDYCRNFIIK